MVGKRHYEVARMLKDIPTGSTFTLRLVEPMKSGFQGIGPRSGPKGANKKGGYGSGKETLRFKANGNAAIEDEVHLISKTFSHKFYLTSWVICSMTSLRNLELMQLILCWIHLWELMMPSLQPR